jgi:hypothetical protein
MTDIHGTDISKPHVFSTLLCMVKTTLVHDPEALNRSLDYRKWSSSVRDNAVTSSGSLRVQARAQRKEQKLTSTACVRLSIRQECSH